MLVSAALATANTDIEIYTPKKSVGISKIIISNPNTTGATVYIKKGTNTVGTFYVPGENTLEVDLDNDFEFVGKGQTIYGNTTNATVYVSLVINTLTGKVVE